MGRQSAQILFDLAAQTLRVTVLDQNIGRRLGQKTLQLLGAALDGRCQAISSKDHPCTRAVKTQIGGKHHFVVFAIIRRPTAQLDGHDRNPPPGQPAGNAVHDHPVGEVGKSTARPGIRFMQHYLRQALLTDQPGRYPFEHQRQEPQHQLQPLGQGGLDHGRAAHERQAAEPQLARVHAKELIILAARQ